MLLAEDTGVMHRTRLVVKYYYGGWEVAFSGFTGDRTYAQEVHAISYPPHASGLETQAEDTHATTTVQIAPLGWFCMQGQYLQHIYRFAMYSRKLEHVYRNLLRSE